MLLLVLGIKPPHLAQQLSLVGLRLPKQDLEPQLVLLSQHTLLFQLHPKPLRPQGRGVVRAFGVVPAGPASGGGGGRSHRNNREKNKKKNNKDPRKREEKKSVTTKKDK